MRDNKLCDRIVQCDGGYVIYGLRWPYGGETDNSGTTVCHSFDEVIKSLKATSKKE